MYTRQKANGQWHSFPYQNFYSHPLLSPLYWYYCTDCPHFLIIPLKTGPPSSTTKPPVASEYQAVPLTGAVVEIREAGGREHQGLCKCHEGEVDKSSPAQVHKLQKYQDSGSDQDKAVNRLISKEQKWNIPIELLKRENLQKVVDTKREIDKNNLSSWWKWHQDG